MMENLMWTCLILWIGCWMLTANDYVTWHWPIWLEAFFGYAIGLFSLGFIVFGVISIWS